MLAVAPNPVNSADLNPERTGPKLKVAVARHRTRDNETSGDQNSYENRDASRRVAVGALIFLAAQLVYIHGDFESFFIRHIANMIVMAACIGAMMRPRLRSHWKIAAFAGCAFIAINGAYSSLLIHEPLAELFTAIIISVGSAALLPWNGWWQAAINLFCGASFIADALTAPAGAIDAHFWAVMFAALAVAQSTAIFGARVRTEHARLDLAIKDGAAKFEAVFRHSLDPISIQRLSDLKFIEVNQAFLALSGYCRDEVIGHSPIELKMFADPASTPDFVDSGLARNGKFHNVEINFRARDGRVGLALVSASIITLAGEECLLATVRNIADRKRSEEQLLAARAAAEAATKAKSAFLAGMSHEIRTPMNAMMGATDILWDSRLDAEQRECVRILRTTGDSLLKLIDGILDLSKIEAERLTIESADFELAEEIASAIDPLAIRAREKNLDLRCQIDHALPRIVCGDALRIRQVLFNVVGNAVKFTQRGSITVNVKPADNAGAIQFAVTDTGIGIPESKLKEIFGEFTQVDSSTTRKYGGTGLGLAISHRLVALMGGDLRAESKLGAGSTFSFVLPLLAAKAAESITPERNTVRALVPKTSSSPLRILLGEDAEDNRQLIRAYLRGTSHLLDTADDGAAVFEKYTNREYDLVLMDVQMPVMDGYSATRAIRNFERETGRAPAPIYALTAFAYREDAEKSLAAGCDGHLTKPMRKAAMLELLETIANSRAHPRLAAAS